LSIFSIIPEGTSAGLSSHFVWRRRYSAWLLQKWIKEKNVGILVVSAKSVYFQ